MQPYSGGQERAPFFEALRTYVQDQVVGLNMPGHVQGRGAPADWSGFFAQAGLAGDITQVLGMDDILRPVGPTQQAQQLAAQAYGADDSHFLVNGTTCGVAAMCLAALNPGEVILVPANAHRSLWNALTLSDGQPRFYPLEWDARLSTFWGPTPQALEDALGWHPECKAIFLTHPNYYGQALEIDKLVDIAHRHNKLVLVDQAWGPHLAFHPALPRCAVAAGADLVVQSTHKLAAALSQGAILHRSGNRVGKQRLRQSLALVLTTSPSTLLVASLDVARRQLALEGRQLLQRAIELADWARQEIQALGFEVCRTSDPTRLIFSAAPIGWSGPQLEEYLRYRSQVQLEMTDPKLCVALVTIGHQKSDLEALLRGLRVLERRAPLDLSWMDRLGS